MAATDMKFGPEWLRQLSDGVQNVGQPPTPPTATAPKYKLAEHRYGREEMLALFNHNCKPPESLQEFPHIYVEKMQPPLALINMTEEESRLWTRVNSDVVLRLMGKNTGNGPERDRGMSERGGPSLRAGRGGNVPERGRGRGRGGYYQRTNYDESGDSPPERREYRTRTFERNPVVNDEMTNSRDKKYERSFSRGGGIGGDDNGSQSRKNINSRSSSVENWRTGGRGEDREGWRTAGRLQETWNRNSWRGGERDYDHENEHSERNGPHKKYTNYQKDRNSSEIWDEMEENDRRNCLPEWSLDDGLESDNKVGTFDASGAFREINNDEENKSEDEKEDENNIKDDKSDEWTNIDKIRKKSSQNSKQAMNDHQNESKRENVNKMNDKPIKKDERLNNTENTSKTQISDNSQHKQQSNQKLIQTQPQKPMSSPSNSINKTSKQTEPSNQPNIKSPLEEDFAHLEKEAESMVAQWTADEDPEEEAPEEQPPIDVNMLNKNVVVLPVQHEDAFKWFYRDPQGEIQGPFTPHEMYDWFTAGYFAMDLLVRRGCDEVFSQLGDLFKIWERIPFLQVQGSTPPPLRSNSSNHSLASVPPPVPPSASHSSMHNMPPHQPIIQQQFQSHSHPPPQQPIFINQHNVDMQSQLRQLLAQLKKQEGFADLSQQQQQEVLVQRYVNLERQRQASIQSSVIPNNKSPPNDSQLSTLKALSNLRIPGTLPQQMQVNNTGHVQSIWDINSGVMSVSAVEELQRKEQERKELEEKRKALEEEHRRKLQQEEMQRKMNEERERRFEELQKKLEEERLRNQELLRKQEEELRRREEEERSRLEEEHNRVEEERRVVEEQRRRQEELMRLEEYARRQQQEDIERRRLLEVEKEMQRKQLQEIEQQRAKEMERLRQMQQQEVLIKMQQQRHQQLQQHQQQQQQQQQIQQQEQNRKVWGQEQAQRPDQSALSLNEIQRLQEEKEREERQRQLQLQQQQMQALFAAQQQQQQQQQNKQNLTWATPAYKQQNVAVKTLAEIQREEAEKVSKQKQSEQKKQQQIQVLNNVPNAGIWNNANSQLFGQNTNTKLNSNNSSAIGFWEPESRKVITNKSNESALNSMQSNTKGSNSLQTKINSRNKKDEESVMRLFENQRRQKTDEFTQWCIEALSKYQSSVDIPTFITFLKDVESPFEINDYVRSYLGEGKDVKDFAKQFIERRSYFRNQAKKEASEELMWGPAPAITPSANKLTQSTPVINQTNSADSEMSGFIQAGKKKKKSKRVIDNSILGFTVQADPDRINAGEIEQIDE